MMAWIESHDELPTHPKTAKLARRIGTSKPAAVGHLHFLWWWCITHRPDGWLRDMDGDDIADAAGWEGDADVFVEGLSAAGWLDFDAEVGDYFVHDWWDGAGKTIKRRKFATTRQRKARDTGTQDVESQDGHADVTRDTQASHGADSDRDRDRDKEPKTSSSAAADPEVSQEARDLTRRFAIAVKANGFKVPRNGTSNRTTWLVDMDRLLRLGAPGGDPHPQEPDEVARVIDFATTDSFWRANIGSPSKFREQYPKLRLRCATERPVADGRRGGVSLVD